MNYSLDFELNDNNYIPNLFGADDKNIQIIEKINNVQIKYRGNKVKVIDIETTKPTVIIQPKSIIGLIPLNIRDKNAQIVVSTV